MSIKIQCEHCQASLTVNDRMAGKRGKCPKCAQMISIPAASGSGDSHEYSGAAAVTGGGIAGASSGWGNNVRSPMDDLLDEAGVKAAVHGPICPSCSAEIQPEAILCIECGFNFAAGRQLKTQIGYDREAVQGGMTENQKIMAKAEQDVALAPLSVEDGDYGDGADAFLVTIGMAVVFAIVVGLGVVTVFLMDKVTTDSGVSMLISFCISIVLTWVGAIWIWIVAFFEGVGHGIACVLVPFYLIYYGFTRLDGLWIPLFMYLVGTLGSMATQVALAMMVS